MKELFILDSSYNPTSAGTNRLLSFGLALQTMGVKVTFYFLFPFKNNEKCDRYTDRLNFVYLWEGARTTNKYFNTIRSLYKFTKLMKPEIPVYVYSLLNCLYFLRKKKGVRIYHEYTENPEVIGKMGGLVGAYLYRKYKQTIPKLDGLFLITPALREMYIKEFGANPSKTFLLNMVVDINRFANLPTLETANKIAYCGILSEFKDGISILIRAFAKVVDKYPDFVLQLIGPFCDLQTEKKLSSLVSDLGLNSKVNFTGVVSPNDMPILLKSARILALARPDNIQAKYGFATKIGEYLMCERPIVLTRVGAVENYLQDEKNCLLANPDDVESFAKKLIWVIEHNDESIEIGKNGKDAALRYFNSENEALKIYDAIFRD